MKIVILVLSANALFVSDSPLNESKWRTRLVRGMHEQK